MFAKSSHRDKIIPHYALETAQCAAGAAFTPFQRGYPIGLLRHNMKRACLQQNTITYKQNHASSIRPLKINFVRMKNISRSSLSI